MPRLTPGQVRALAAAYDDWDADWVVWQVFDAGTGNGESSGYTDAFNPAGPYRGLMQIWDVNARRFGFAPEDMNDPAKNLDVAHRLHAERGKQPWPSSANYRRPAVQFPPDETSPVQPWLKGPRPAGCTPKLIIIHATRGNNTQAKQYAATKSWFNSPNNGSAAQGWGGCATVVISHEGQLCRFMDELREIPRFSAGYGEYGEPQGWNADHWGLSIELAQSAAQEPFDPRTLERAAQLTATWCARYGIEPVHLGPTLQRGAAPARTGIAGHDELENGTKLGKSDPGPQFPWSAFAERVRALYQQTEAPDEEGTMRMMKRWNAVVPGLAGMEVRRGSPCRVDLALFRPVLPEEVRVLRVEVYASPLGNEEPELSIHDGDGAYAGQLGWGRAPDGYAQVDILPQGGFFELRGAGRLNTVGLVGYW